ncbi:MAG TPA: HNH endonuclease family protein [Ilumatobacteraceae bacterium]|nr:HNH endonuclease family protein [Ilumatobacteraceae bacterium]
MTGDPGADDSKINLVSGTSEPSTTASTTPSSATTAPAATPSATATVAATTTSSTNPTTSTSIVAPPATIPGSVLALDVLGLITVENERQDGYDRDLFAYGDTVDSRGCRTRALVLIRDSLSPAQVDPVGCAVVAGDWYSVYDGVAWSDPAELEIDHVVALKEAWDSGAWGWTPERRSAFGNDLADARSLRAVTAAVNQDKSAADPSNWLPPDPGFVCTYLSDWVSIKARWSLSMDQSEHGRIRNLLTDRCPDQTIAPWPDTASPGPPVTSPPVVVVPPPLSPAGGCDPSYPDVCIPASPPDLDCGDITFRRFTVLPPDPHRFDGDGNGIGCES